MRAKPNSQINRHSIGPHTKLNALARSIRSATLGLSIGVAGLQMAHAATLVVDSEFDTVSGCTLRRALMSFNNPSVSQPSCSNSSSDPFGSNDRIEMALNVNSISLSNGQLNVSPVANLSIVGGQTGVTVDANKNSRVLSVAGPSKVTLEQITLTGGSTNTVGGGIYCASCDLALISSTVEGNLADINGGAIASLIEMRLELQTSTISGNQAVNGSGGGIYLYQDATAISLSDVDIIDSTISDNTAAFNGGGIYATERLSSQKKMPALGYSNVHIENSKVINNHANYGAGLSSYNIENQIRHSTIANNTASRFGGGIFFTSSLTTPTELDIYASTFSNNKAAITFGGGISLAGGSVAMLKNSTVSGNLSNTSGAGIQTSGRSLELINTTISNNEVNATLPFAAVGLNANSASVSLVNSMIANSIGGDDCATSTTLQHDSASIIEDQTCSASIRYGDPSLRLLANNGGATKTQALKSDSSAINTGDPQTCLTLDQRGETRNDAVCDVGAYEYINRGFFVIKGKNGKIIVVPE